MSWISGIAVYFIIWWTVLFIALPFGLKTQDEDGDVTLGTVASAPRGPHMLRAIVLTSIIAGVVFAAFYVVTKVYGLGFGDIPHIVPEFS